MMIAARLLSTTMLTLALATSGDALAQPDQKGGQQQKSQQQQQQQQQQAAQQQKGQRPPVILMRDWNYQRIYGSGWSAERLMDEATVYGPSGDDIGSVENIVISQDGKVVGIIAQVGGFLDIGDTHVFVPWDQVKVGPGLERVTIPVSEENVEEYSTWADEYLRRAETGQRRVVEADLTTGPRIWRATELIGDYALLDDNVGYGNVNDLIFTKDGNLHAVVVSAYAPFGGGYYAFPYYGYPYGWSPGYASYYLGYDRDEVPNLEKFDYRRMNQNAAAQDQSDQGATTGASPDAEPRAPASGKKNQPTQRKSQ